MAIDEVMLHSAVSRGVASLRFYTWSEPTLSLGYFQSLADRDADPRLASVAVVRRHTGGAAILHDRELTYSIALPAGRPWQDAESWICRAHHALAAVFQATGVPAAPVVCGNEKKLGPFLCFQHQTPGDLLVDGHKIVGSAQRRPHGALLQHGSVLLSQSEHAPVLPGVSELNGPTISPAELAEKFLDRLRHETGWTFEPGELTEEEKSLSLQIEQEKYGSAEWTAKR